MQSIRLTNTIGIIFKINYRIEKRKSKIDNGQLHYLIGNQDDDFEIYFLSSGFTVETTQRLPFKFSPTLGILMIDGLIEVKKAFRHLK